MKNAKHSHGAYRSCKVCGKPIPKPRLAAIPDTKVCVRCSHVRTLTVKDIPTDGTDIRELINSMQGGS